MYVETSSRNPLLRHVSCGKVLNEPKQHGLTAVVVLCVERVLGEEVLRLGAGAAAKRHEFVEVLEHRAVLTLIARDPHSKAYRATNVVGRGGVVHHTCREVSGLFSCPRR